MNILQRIVERKRVEVAERKISNPIEKLKDTALYQRQIFSLVEGLQKNNASGIIAEFKRKSPSKGIINDRVDPIKVTEGYQNAGASAVSILTDADFFGGSEKDLMACRAVLDIPILRKDFVVDRYQLYEAKAIGADLVLLIAACLTPEEVLDLSAEAHAIGLEVLLELHDEDELNHVAKDVDLVGINNRSLKTFDVDIERSLRMAASIPGTMPKVAESGIDDPAQIRIFKENGYKAFLIGENFMKREDPGKALKEFIDNI
ncbi:MAG: indole-3-glycerol phosphate synthase TrpC [Chitinophagia bacterium]|nr:indole-3-glycerol phosphate synthase TrpC [Chitinophagia bacterium]